MPNLEILLVNETGRRWNHADSQILDGDGDDMIFRDRIAPRSQYSLRPPPGTFTGPEGCPARFGVAERSM